MDLMREAMETLRRRNARHNAPSDVLANAIKNAFRRRSRKMQSLACRALADLPDQAKNQVMRELGFLAPVPRA